MSHAVSPTGFRSGKFYPWSHNTVSSLNNKQTALDKNVNLALGVEATTNSLLRRNNYWTVKSTTKHDAVTGVTKLNVLYYPLVSPILRKRVFPTYCSPRNLLNQPSSYTESFKKVMAKVWSSKNRAFDNRFIRAKPRPNLNRIVMKAMFRGTKLFRGFKKLILVNKHKKFKLKTRVKKVSKYLKNKFTHYDTKKNRWIRWRLSKQRLNARLLSKQLSKRVGSRVQIKFMNAFTYLLKKTKVLHYGTAQQRIWNKRYHYNKKRFTSYYDIVNSLFLLCHIPYSEGLVIKMIQYGLTKMHRRKIRPKNFFYFINSVISNMPEIKKKFNALRLVITGKLRGGTSRTKSFNTGFGVIPVQTIEKNIRYEFGNVRSKYGSFGVKLFTWRKSETELLSERRNKWVQYRERRKTHYKLKVKKFKSKRRIKKLKFAKYTAIKKAYNIYVNILNAHKTVSVIALAKNLVKQRSTNASTNLKIKLETLLNNMTHQDFKARKTQLTNLEEFNQFKKKLSKLTLDRVRLAALNNIKPSRHPSINKMHLKMKFNLEKSIISLKAKKASDKAARKLALIKRKRWLAHKNRFKKFGLKQQTKFNIKRKRWLANKNKSNIKRKY